MGNTWSQIFPPTPTLTEKNLPNQDGKVFIVTGASGGIGRALAEILYLHNAKVYVAARSEEKASKAISEVKSRVPESNGSLIFLHLDLDDLTTIKSTVEAFLRDNDRLDILWNNAGVMIPPQGSKTKQGYDLQLGTNNVAPFLFTKLLYPILAKTAKTAPADSVRVVWVSSNGAEYFSPKGGVDLDNLDFKVDKSTWVKYGTTKAGNILHASEFAKRQSDGIISLSLNPGGIKTDLQRHTPKYQLMLIRYLLHEPIYGAYTELFAGLSPEANASKNGAYIVPWGRFGHPLRKDLLVAQKTEEEGGSGHAAKFWEWSEEQVKPFL